MRQLSANYEQVMQMLPSQAFRLGFRGEVQKKSCNCKLQHMKVQLQIQLHFAVTMLSQRHLSKSWLLSMVLWHQASDRQKLLLLLHSGLTHNMNRDCLQAASL